MFLCEVVTRRSLEDWVLDGGRSLLGASKDLLFGLNTAMGINPMYSSRMTATDCLYEQPKVFPSSCLGDLSLSRSLNSSKKLALASEYILG